MMAETPARGPQRGQRRVHRAQDSEDVGLELTPVILQGEGGDRTDHAEPGVGHGDVEPAEGLQRAGHRALEVAVAGHVAQNHERAPRVLRFQLRGQPLEPVHAPRGQGEVGAPPCPLARERLADA